MRKIILNLLLILFASLALQAQPTNNPIRDKYGMEPDFPVFPFHWTDSIRWDNVFNIRNYVQFAGTVTLGLDDVRTDWLGAYNAARDAAAAAGGGVVYFPKLGFRKSENFFGDDSTYYFSDNILLKNNVILRGDAPIINDATSRGFSPRSYIEFPKYNYAAGAGQGNGTPNSTAFKEIIIDTTGIVGPGRSGFRNTGVIFLNINRGRIAAHPTFAQVQLNDNTTANWAVEKCRNFVVFGTRSNNVALPDPGVPTANMNGWDRFPWRFAANIDVYVTANAIICNNRLNDYRNNDSVKVDEDAFIMAGYNPSGDCGPLNQQFDYNAHYGIFLNRFKRTGYTSAVGFLNNSTPATEPDLFARGNVVRDNWIFKTSRVGIQAGGLGLVIKGNVIRDDESKETFVAPTGTSCNVNPQATYENRGIDIAGWNITVENNDIEFFRTRLPNISATSFSADGEGIYSQSISGSTMRDYFIRNNIVRTNSNGLCNTLIVAAAQGKGFSGLYNTGSIFNVVVENNNFGGTPFRISANSAGSPGILNRIFVRNNTNIHSAELLGNACGDSVFFNNNTGSCPSVPCQGIPALRANSYVCLSADNTQCSTNSNGPIPCLGPASFTGENCNASATMCGFPLINNFPVVSFTSPSVYETIVAPGTNVPLSVSYKLEFCDPDSIVFFANGFPLPGAVTLNTANQTASYNNYFAPVQPLFDIITARLCKTSDQGVVICTQSNSRKILVVTEVADLLRLTEVNLFPNPAKGNVMLNLSSMLTGTHQVKVYDLAGKVHLVEQLMKTSESAEAELSTARLKPGIYFIEISVGKHKIVRKLVKE
jgi:hypothetical protein